MVYYLYRIKWHLARFINFKSPVHIDIELTNRCNQKCISCWHSGDPIYKHKDMDIALVKSLIDEAEEMGVKSLKFNLRGESTLYPCFIAVLKYTENKFVDVMLNTNGVIRTDKLIEALPYINTLIISVDSWDKETYKKLHGANDYQHSVLMYNLCVLKVFKVSKEIKTRIKLNFHRNYFNRKENFFDSYFKIFEHIEKNTMPREGRNISIAPYQPKIRKTNCPHMMRRLTVLSNGKIYPCCVCYTEPSDIEITENTLKKAWNSTKRQLLLNKYKKGEYTKSCQDCTSAEIYK